MLNRRVPTVVACLLVIGLSALVVYGSGGFLGQLGKGFMPDEDEGRFIVSFRTPQGAGIEYTRDRLQRIEQVLQAYLEIGKIWLAGEVI